MYKLILSTAFWGMFLFSAVSQVDFYLEELDFPRSKVELMQEGERSQREVFLKRHNPRGREHQLRINEREIPIQTSDGTTPTERQLETIKNILTDDFLVNDDTTGGTIEQYYPSIAMDGSGNFVIVWIDDRNGNFDIYYQRYNPSGVTQGVNTKVNDDVGTTDQWFPSVAMDGSGGASAPFVIVWKDYRNGNDDIYFQRYSSTGTAVGTNTKANDNVGTASQWSPSIAMDGSGGASAPFVIVWDDYRNGNYDIYFQRYSSTGTAVGTNTKANDDIGTAGQVYPSISMDVNGNFAVVWVDFRNGMHIYLQRFDSTGLPQGTNLKVDDDGRADRWDPSISMDGNGNTVIVWIDDRNGFLNSDIYLQRYDSAGVAQGANLKVNDDEGTVGQSSPSVSMDGSGNFVVVWADFRYGSYNPDVIGQRYNTDGTSRGANYRIVADGPNNGETSPVVVANASQIVFSWMDNRRSKGWDIYAKVVGWDWDGVVSVENGRNGELEIERFALMQNYPNPFNPSTTIRFDLPQQTRVILKIYNILGHEVRTLVSGALDAGYHSYIWDGKNQSGKDVSSGIYLYRIEADKFSKTMKLLLLR